MTQIPSVFIDIYSPDVLIAGETQLATRSYTLLSGQVLKRGTMVGMITSSGKLTLSTTAASDGSHAPFGILIDDYDATAADLGGCGVYIKGEFNQGAVIFGAGWTAATAFAALRDGGI